MTRREIAFRLALFHSLSLSFKTVPRYARRMGYYLVGKLNRITQITKLDPGQLERLDR